MQSTGRGREVTVTNDGATILKSLHIDNPAAKVLVGILVTVFLRFGLYLLYSQMVRDVSVCLHINLLSCVYFMIIWFAA